MNIWKHDIENIPKNTPVLFRLKDNPVPFMGIRDLEDEETGIFGINCLLGTDGRGYGIYENSTDIEAYMEVSKTNTSITDKKFDKESHRAFQDFARRQIFIKDVQRYPDDWHDKKLAGQYGHYDTQTSKTVWDAACEWLLK